jgi:hypothetical protein
MLLSGQSFACPLFLQCNVVQFNATSQQVWHAALTVAAAQLTGINIVQHGKSMGCVALSPLTRTPSAQNDLCSKKQQPEAAKPPIIDAPS